MLLLSAVESSWWRHAGRMRTACDLQFVRMHIFWLVRYFSRNPSILPNDRSPINISLSNLKQELIKLLIFYHSYASATFLQVAVPSLRLWVYCCFSGWCLNWLANLSGLMGFWVASAAQGRQTARHRNTVGTDSMILLQFNILFTKVNKPESFRKGNNTFVFRCH